MGYEHQPYLAYFCYVFNDHLVSLFLFGFDKVIVGGEVETRDARIATDLVWYRHKLRKMYLSYILSPSISKKKRGEKQDMNRLFKVSRRLARIGGISLSAVAMFPRDRPVISRKVNRVNSTLSEESIYIDFPGFLFLEFPRRYSEPNYGGYMAITVLGKVDFLILLDKIINVLRNEKVFFESSPGHLGIYTVRDENGAVSNPWRVQGKVGDVPVILEPVVVYDNTNEIEYEGVRFTIRNYSTYHDLTFSELISLRTIVSESNIFVYTQLLLQTVGLNTTARNAKEQEDFQAVQTRLDNLSEVSTLESRRKKMGDDTNGTGLSES